MMFDRVDRRLWWDDCLTLVEGCTRVSEACDHCWSGIASHMRSKQTKNQKMAARHAGLTNPDGTFNGQIRLFPEALDKLKRPKSMALSVWNDLFHKSVPDQFIYKCLSAFAAASHHIIMICTKRPDRMARMMAAKSWGSDKPRNIWVGTTVEKIKYMPRIEHLASIDVPVRFLSLEPLLEWLPMDNMIGNWNIDYKNSTVTDGVRYRRPFDWVIVGAETGRKPRIMKPQWVNDIVVTCGRWCIPVFVKSMGRGVEGLDIRQVPDWKGCVNHVND
jgi:protein gp37